MESEKMGNASFDPVSALKRHWPEYAIEAWGLGVFMVAACASAVLLEYPASPVYESISNPFFRRVLMGLAMGLTATGIIYSKWGRRSGAHINPCVTLVFYRLKKVQGVDALFYVLAQFLGGMIGVGLSRQILGPVLSHPNIHYVATVPGMEGHGIAFLLEFLMSFFLMGVLLVVSQNPRLSKFDGVFAGALVAAYIAFEAPFSGMSINPARSFGSAVFAKEWSVLWIYFTAPLLGMLTASEIYIRFQGISKMICAKRSHSKSGSRIFSAGRVI